jgi:hypothetical protein
LYAAAGGNERVGAGAPQIIFTVVSSVTGSIGSQKNKKFSLDASRWHLAPAADAETLVDQLPIVWDSWPTKSWDLLGRLAVPLSAKFVESAQLVRPL